MPETAETLSAIAYGEAPVLETLAQMNLDTLERSGLDEKTYMMIRIAGLVAMDAPPVSYAINLGAGIDVIDLEALQGILVTLAPVVGSARIASAASNILDVFFNEGEGDEAEDTEDDVDERIAERMQQTATSSRRMEADEDEDTADQDRQFETV